MGKTSRVPPSREKRVEGLRKQQNEALKAKRAYENPQIQAALKAIEDACRDGFENSAADDDRGRYNAYLMLRILKHFRTHFKKVISRGADAKRMIEEIMADAPKSDR